MEQQSPPSAQPTRADVAAAMCTMCDVLREQPAVQADSTMDTKLRAIRNYADTMFSASDLAKLRQMLLSRPALLNALRACDIDAVSGAVDVDSSGNEHVAYALTCINQVHPSMKAQDKEALWQEVATLCELCD